MDCCYLKLYRRWLLLCDINQWISRIFKDIRYIDEMISSYLEYLAGKGSSWFFCCCCCCSGGDSKGWQGPKKACLAWPVAWLSPQDDNSDDDNFWSSKKKIFMKIIQLDEVVKIIFVIFFWLFNANDNFWYYMWN